MKGLLVVSFLILVSSCSYMKGSESFLSNLSRSIASTESLDSQMASIRSIVNEINTNGNKVIHLYMYPKPKIEVFDSNDRIKTLLAKMKVAQKELLLQTSQTDINSPAGQKNLLMTVDYLQAVVTINKLYAQIAHLPYITGAANPTSNYDWKNLDPYNLKIDKDYALLLLSKINFLAKHMTNQEISDLGLSTTLVKKAVEIKLGGEIRQLLEHLAVSDPMNVKSYGKFIKFNALKETMINAWGINRLYKEPYNGIAITGNATKDSLTFRPGPNNSFSTSAYYEELMQSDNFYNVFSFDIQKVVAASISTKTISMSIGTTAEYEELYRNLIWGYPESESTKIVPYFKHLRDYFLGRGKYEGYEPYTKSDVAFRFPGGEVRETEEYDFNGDAADAQLPKGHVPNYGKYPHLFYSVLAGDDLTPENVAQRMADEAYHFRSEAIIHHLHYRIVDYEFTEQMQGDLRAHIRTLVDARFKTRYINHFKSVTKPILEKSLTYANMVQKKVNDKYAGLKKALKATEGVKSTYILHHVAELNKMPKTAALHPRTPEILIAMIKNTLQEASRYDLIFSLEDEVIGKVLKNYYSDLSNAYYKAVSGEETFDQMTQVLWEKANEIAYTYSLKYPYSYQDEVMHDIIKENVVQQDNTYVDPTMKYIYVDRSSLQPTQGQAGKAASQLSTKPITFDQKLETLMLTFQPFVQGQDYKDLQTKQNSMENVEVIDVMREKYKAKETLGGVKVALYKLFRVIGLDPASYDYRMRKTGGLVYNKLAMKSLGSGPVRQQFLAEQNLGLLKMTAPILQNKIFYKEVKKTVNAGQGMVSSYMEKIYKPAIFVMAMKAYNETTDTIDDTLLNTYIQKSMTASRTSLKGQAHADTPATPFKEGLFETFAQADPGNPQSDKRFQFMYDHLEELRGIIMHANGNENQQTRFAKFDEALFSVIHPYKHFYEKHIAPVINVVIAILMVVSILVGFIFPPAGIPGWLAASLLIFEVSAFTYIMADSIGYRIVYQRMIEIPATLKMQGHFAAIQSVGESPLNLMYKKGASDQTTSYKINSVLDSWDRIDAAEKANIEERKSLIYERLMWLPLDLMWGGSIVKQFKKFTGSSGMRAMKKMGLPVLSFRQKTQLIFKTNNWEQVFKERGLIRGVGTVGKDIVTGLPQVAKLLPKYQPYAAEILQKHGLRVGLHNKFIEIYESGKYAKEFSKVVADVKYSIEGENIILHQLFNEIKKFETAQFKKFLETQGSNKISILMEKIQASLDKGITPLELSEMSALTHTPKTVWGILFSGIFEKSRLNKLKSVLKPGIEPAEALSKFREAKALNDVSAISKVFDEVVVTGANGYKEEILIQVFEQAGLKTTLANTMKTITKNYNSWKSLKAPEVELSNNMLKLKEELKNAKHIRSKALLDKVKSVEELLEKNPEFYKDLKFSSVNDYWWSILDHSDLMMIQELSAAAKKGTSVREFSLVFVDYKTVMESIRPLDWKAASDSRALRPFEQGPTFKTDYEDIIIDDANIFPADGFGEKKNSAIKLLETTISDQLLH